MVEASSSGRSRQSASTARQRREDRLGIGFRPEPQLACDGSEEPLDLWRRGARAGERGQQRGETLGADGTKRAEYDRNRLVDLGRGAGPRREPFDLRLKPHKVVPPEAGRRTLTKDRGHHGRGHLDQRRNRW